MASIHLRPPQVEVPGPRPVGRGLIQGTHNASAVGTLVERTTLFVTLAKLDNGTAEPAVAGFSTVLNRIDFQRRLSLTYDQGKEMSQHEQLSQNTGVIVYFADPYSIRQRGMNKNTSGLLREYVPKSADLPVFTPARARRDRLVARYSAQQIPGLEMPRRVIHPRRVRLQSPLRKTRCTWELKPPLSDSRPFFIVACPYRMVSVWITKMPDHHPGLLSAIL